MQLQVQEAKSESVQVPMFDGTIRRNTPWGMSQMATVFAEGITFFSTASHGGFHLSGARLRQMDQSLRTITPFAGPGWYEEDWDAAIVVCAFPEYFNDEEVFNALRMLQQFQPEAVPEFLATPQGHKVWTLYDRVNTANANRFEIVSSGTDGNGWVCHARSVNGEHRIEFSAPSRYHLPPFFTTEELDALGYPWKTVQP